MRNIKGHYDTFYWSMKTIRKFIVRHLDVSCLRWILASYLIFSIFKKLFCWILYIYHCTDYFQVSIFTDSTALPAVPRNSYFITCNLWSFKTIPATYKDYTTKYSILVDVHFFIYLFRGQKYYTGCIKNGAKYLLNKKFEFEFGPCYFLTLLTSEKSL